MIQSPSPMCMSAVNIFSYMSLVLNADHGHWALFALSSLLHSTAVNCSAFFQQSLPSSTKCSNIAPILNDGLKKKESKEQRTGVKHDEGTGWRKNNPWSHLAQQQQRKQNSTADPDEAHFVLHSPRTTVRKHLLKIYVRLSSVTNEFRKWGRQRHCEPHNTGCI